MKTGMRWMALAAVLSLTLTGCAGWFDDVGNGSARPMAEFMCAGITFYFVGTEEGVDKCADYLLGAGQSDGWVVAGSGGAAWGAPPDGKAAGRATQTGEVLMGFYVAGGKVPAGQFPQMVLGVPRGPGEVDVQVGAAILDLEDGTPKEVFDALDVTLRRVDTGSGPAVIGESRGKFTKKKPMARVAFENVAGDEPLEVVVDFAGGSIQDCLVLLDVGARATSGTATAGWVTASERAFSRVAPDLTPPKSEVGKLFEMVLVFVEARGKVKSSRVPEIAIDLPVDGGGEVDVSASLQVLSGDFTVPKSKFLPKSVAAEVLAVDRNGEKTRLARATRKVDKEGGAGFEFEGVKVPNGADLRVVLDPVGKRVKNSMLMALATAG